MELRDFLNRAAASIRRDGWRSSRDFAEHSLEPTYLLAGEIKATEVTFDDKILAKVALEWAASLTPDPDNDYLAKIRDIAKAGKPITKKTRGLAASIIRAYTLDVERRERKRHWAEERAAERKRNAGSEYVGEVGARWSFSLKLEKLIKINGHYGLSTLHKFRDGDGNVVIWFKTGGPCGNYEGAEYLVTGRIKAHKEYDGIKQTVLTRCKMIEKEPALAAAS
jgi:hypothetical protein